jgi:hypothetical protein
VIFTWLAQFLVGVVTAAINVLPTGSWSPDLSGFTTVLAYLHGFHDVLPLMTDAVFGVLSVALAYQGASLGYHGFMWLVHRLPFVGS